MYLIESKPFGFSLRFEGSISAAEMQEWVEASKEVLKTAPKHFGVLADLRSLKPLVPESKVVMEVGQKLYKSAGLTRSVVILDSSLLAVQFKNIAWATGIYEWERYITASEHADWNELALNWIMSGIDPDAIARR